MDGDKAKIRLLQEKLKEAADLFLALDATGGGTANSAAVDSSSENLSSGIPGADALMVWIQDRPSPQMAPVEGEGVATALLGVMAAMEAFEDAVDDGRDSRQSISGEWFVGQTLEDSDGC